MPPYNRFRGERVTYSQVRTSLYKSQRIRWIKGQTYSPNIVIYQDDGTILLRYRSYRATDGFWECIFDPSGHLPGEDGDPGGGGSGGVCGVVPGQCLPSPLLYTKVVQSTTSTRTCPDPEAPNTRSITDNYSTVYEFYLVAPGGSVPPSPGITPVFFMPSGGVFTGNYPAGCVNGFLEPQSETVSFTDSNGNFHTLTSSFVVFHLYDESADRVYRYTASSGTIVNTGRYAANVNDPCSYENGMGSVSTEFFFEDGSTITDHSSCVPGAPGLPPSPGEPGSDTPLRYVCNCPDYTKIVEALPWSRYSSELVTRDIVGRTHSGDDGPCKHVYSASNVMGERFRDPATVNDPWTLQDYPLRTIVLDWLDPIPPVLNGDNNIDQLRQWREDRRTRRAEAYRLSTLAFTTRQAEAKKKREEFFQFILNSDPSRAENLSDEAYKQFVEYRDRQNSSTQQWRQRNRNTHGYDDDGSGSS